MSKTSFGQQMLSMAGQFRLWKPAHYVQQAATLIQNGELEEAEELLNRALTSARAWSELWWLKSRVANQRGDKDAEQECLVLALERNPSLKKAEAALLEISRWRYQPLQLAWQQYHAGAFEKALYEFNRATNKLGVQVPPSSAGDIHAGRGWCFLELSKTKLAKQAFLLATKFDVNLVHSWRGLGICNYRLGEISDARSALQSALKLEPNLHQAKAMLGWCAYSEHDNERADKIFSDAVEQNPMLADAWWGKAWANWWLENVERSRSAFLYGIELDPFHPAAENAIAHWGANPSFVDLLLFLAWSQLEHGNPTQALTTFDASFGLVNRAQACVGRAASLHALGRTQEALQALKVLSLDELSMPLHGQPEGTKLAPSGNAFLQQLQELTHDDAQGSEQVKGKFSNEEMSLLESLVSDSSTKLDAGNLAPEEITRWRRCWLIGMRLLRGGQSIEALKWFQAHPLNVECALASAQVLQELGRNKESRQAIEKAMSCHSDDADLATALISIKNR